MTRRKRSELTQNTRAGLPGKSVPTGGGRSTQVSSRWTIILASGLIVLATVAAFSNSFAGPFVFDDETAILGNPTIRQLWPLWPTLCPPRHGETVTGRPLLNLSLAINLRHQRRPGLELPCDEPGHSRSGSLAAVRHHAADVALAGDTRAVGHGQPSPGTCGCPAVGDPSAANGVGDVSLSSGPSR